MNNDYLEIDPFASRMIYKDFISGKIINKYEILEGELQPSPKFNELVGNLDKYRYLYDLLGFEIRSIGNESFFVTRGDRLEEYNEIAANIQVLILCIARGVYSLGIAPCILLDPTSGISTKMLDDIGELEEQNRILEVCKLKRPLSDSVASILLNRGIMLQLPSGRFVLSQSGRFMFNQIISKDECSRVLEEDTDLSSVALYP